MAYKKKKDPVMVPTVIVEQPQQLVPVKTSNALAPSFGMNVDAQMAVSYVTSTRRKHLRLAKEAAELKRKEIHSQLSALGDAINKEIPKSAAGVGNTWAKTLNATFKDQKVQLVAFPVLPKEVSSLDSDKCFPVTLTICRGDPSKADEAAIENRNYGGGVYSSVQAVKANQAILDAFDNIAKCQNDIQKVQDITLTIQKEINELQYTSMDTQAALFAQTMQSDPNGKAILATLDAQLAKYAPIPELPADLGAVK